MAEDGDIRLAELLCARICHDLAGPVGAVGTGAELLADEDLGGGLAAEALSLLATSAVTAGGRLRFLRLALGRGGADIASAHLRDLVASFLASPVTGAEGWHPDWQDAEAGPWRCGAAKLLLNMVLLARDCLPRGGTVVVRARAAGGPAISVAAEGTGAAPGESAAALRASSVDGLNARGIQGYYTARLAAGLEWRIEQDVERDRVIFFTAPG